MGKTREKIKKKLKEKIRSQAGESLAETLVSMLISAVALVMLAGAIAAATNVIKQSQNQLDKYYETTELMVNRKDDTEVKGSGKITITYGEKNKEANITYYKNDKFVKTPVVTYTYKPSN